MNMKDFEKNNFKVIVKHLAGSHAYGMNLPTSDVDYRGVFIAPKKYIISPFYNVEEFQIDDEEDTKFYQLNKFIKLLVDQNPNILETLWVDDSDIVYKNRFYDVLRGYRKELLSSKVAFTYSGYAYSQIKRMKGHHKHINNPKSVDPPKQNGFIKVIQWFDKDYSTLENINEDHRLIPYGNNIFGIVKRLGFSLYNDQGMLNQVFVENDRSSYNDLKAIVKFNYNEYDREKIEHQQYWQWLNNRNKVRAELEQKIGYDSKHMAHCIRLLRTGKEILTLGEVFVKRPDANELLEIRNGCKPYEEMLNYAEELNEEIEKLYKTTSLPKQVNLEKVSEIIINIYEESWNE